ncbi:MAG TPA: serine protease [Mycobacteriales bacterium]|nr:serine protease [Mycobacteriales bacterium]
MEHRRRALFGGAALLVALATGLAGQSAAQAADVGGGAAPNVVGGTNAAAGEFPWMVRLSQGCGGALIASRVVLTAAHCVTRTGTNTSITATIGRIRLTDTSTGQVIRSTYIFRSPTYASTLTRDWSLIELASAPTGVPLLSLVGQGDTSLNNGDFTVMGWGATREGGGQSPTLRKATVPFVSDASCQQSYPQDLAPATEICAGFAQGGVDTCQGDSGGPMTKRDASGTWREIGIVSYGNGCARPNFPGVYGEVQSFSADIRARISSTGTIIR